MQDIRLVDSDGEYLNLETQGGEKFRLVLDDSLRSAIKRDSQVFLDSVSISPREIQDEVRAGASAEEVAAKYSVPLDYVEKFALTVVDEIGHIIASAQTVRISVEADRFSEATHIEFGEVLDGRLRKINASNAVWSATKLDGSPWMVTVGYDAPEGNASAVWSFDPRKLVLSPENESAVRLSAGDFAASAATPKLRQLEPTVESTRVIELPRQETQEPGIATPLAAPVSPVSSIEELTRSSIRAIEDAVEETQTPDVQEAPELVEPHQAEEPAQLSPTADLLEALRKKRAEATAAQTIAEPTTEEETPVVEEIQAAPVTPPAKKGRPSMPSWDEIVFGTKTDD